MIPRRARVTDPETSQAAAASQDSERVSILQGFVYTVLLHYGPLCDKDIEAEIRTRYPEFHMTDAGVRTRRAELVHAGLVRDSGAKVKLDTGRYAIAWEIVRG